MSFAPRDDLPGADGLENLGPLGSLAHHEDQLLRIPRGRHRFAPRAAVPVADAGPLRDAARLVSEGLVFTSHHAHASQREAMTRWVLGALGPPRATHPLGPNEQIMLFEGVVLLLMNHAFTLACADRERLAVVLAHPSVPEPSLAPAQYAYEPIATFPPFEARLGAVTHPRSLFGEAFELHRTELGCGVRGVLDGAFSTTFLMKPGGVSATVPRHAERFARASSLGEWQPGLRDVDALSALLEAHQATEAHTRVVLSADELVGGFRGERGVDLLAPWAGSRILDALGHGTISPFWTQPRHPYNGAWFLGWATTAQVLAKLYVDEQGRVWDSWQDPSDDLPEIHRIGEAVAGWFERQLYLLDHGYASDATCRWEQALPPGLSLREDLSDAAAQVYEDGDAVWLVEERGIQRMSRRVPTVADVLTIAARFK